MAPIRNMATLALVALIAGCGSGGGGNDAPANSADLAIQGDVMKGPMAKAKISLYKTTAEGQQGDLLLDTTSDDKGHYSATAKDYSGVMMLVASVVAGQTTMYDEATGLTISPAASFSMRASFPAEAGKTYSAQINPFTDSATAAALAKTGGLSALNVAQANKDVAEALSFDPLTTAADFDATSKAPKNAAAAALTALSKMAESGELGCVGDQAAKVACVTKALSGKGLSEKGVKDALQKHINAVTFAAGLPALSIKDPSGTPVSGASALEQAKDFFGTLRSNVKALDATDVSLKTELQAVADDMKHRTAPIAKTSLDALNVARLGVQFWNDVIRNPSAPFVATKNFSAARTSYGYSEPLGGCSVFSDTDYTIVATSRADAKYLACGTVQQFVPATNANGEYKPCRATGEWCSTNWSVRVRLQPDVADASKFTVYTQTRAAKIVAKALVNGNVSAYTEERTHYGAAFPGNAATVLTQSDSSGKVTALSLSGELSPAYQVGSGSSHYNTSLAMWTYLPPAVTVLGDKHDVTLSAALSKVGELDKLAVSGSIALIKNGALETRIELADGSYLQAKQDATGSYSAQDGSQEMLLKLKASTAGSAVTGDLKISAFMLDASNTSYVPTLLSFAGSVQRNGVSFFEGTLTGEALNHASFKSNQPRSPTNEETARLSFTGRVIIPTRPILKVSLSVVNHARGGNANDTADLAGQYSQGSITINLAGNTSAASDILKLESSEGISLVIDKAKSSHPLTKGSEQVGVFSTANSRVTYSDNSYEQF